MKDNDVNTMILKRSRNIISYYYNLESLDNLLAVKAEGVNSSGSSARTD